jgi:hypothetical protein
MQEAAVTIHLREVLVETGSNDREGRLVFSDNRLVGLLVQLSPDHGSAAGHWFLEARFGILNGDKTFADLEEAAHWIGTRTKGSPTMPTTRLPGVTT